MVPRMLLDSPGERNEQCLVLHRLGSAILLRHFPWTTIVVGAAARAIRLTNSTPSASSECVVCYCCPARLAAGRRNCFRTHYCQPFACSLPAQPRRTPALLPH